MVKKKKEKEKENMVSRGRLAEFILPTFSLSGHVLLGKLLYLSIPKFPHPKREIITGQTSLRHCEE